MVALVRTRGRLTGRDAMAVVGYAESPDGSLVVAAGEPDADWALNLVAEPVATVTIGELTADYRAREIEGAERAAAIGALILKYGTPAERLGRGPAFRLARVG